MKRTCSSGIPIPKRRSLSLDGDLRLSCAQAVDLSVQKRSRVAPTTHAFQQPDNLYSTSSGQSTRYRGFKAPPRTSRKTPSNLEVFAKDSVNVYCRILPMQVDTKDLCVNLISSTTVQLVPPKSAVNHRPGTYREIQYTFKHVFDASSTQKDVFKEVALPLVEDLIQGRNGLLFTYGVTGCGNTFTMSGDNNGGIIPRCLDVLFYSISDFQANKFIFKPDKMNGFEVQSARDATIEMENELCSRALGAKISKGIQQSYDSTKIENIDEKNTYAVFITYIEIYNNLVHDLLEDISDEAGKTKSLQSKVVREDASRNMYVQGVTEIEVKTTNEAFDVFSTGLKKKRMAHTTLNAESSRSHSVFTLRLVQAPIDDKGENIIDDKKLICISQLSLVSERSSRTKNIGQRLREAGSINSSLKKLRNCFEALRENQLQGRNKIVPYREAKLTHLFKNFFYGKGQIQMVVCISPPVDDYDEMVQVMKFAEMTQEVQLSRPLAVRNKDLDLMPGRRVGHPLLKQAMQLVKDNGNTETGNTEDDYALVYHRGPESPPLEMMDCHGVQTVETVVALQEHRMNSKTLLVEEKIAKATHFRSLLVDMEKENISLKAALDQKKKKTTALESRLMTRECLKLNLEMELIILRQELKEKDMLLNQLLLKKEQTKQKYCDKIAEETEKISREMKQILNDNKQEMEMKMRSTEETLQLLKQILGDNGSIPCSTVSTSNGGEFDAIWSPLLTPPDNNVVPLRLYQSPQVTSRRMGPAVGNPGHRRSRFANGDVWIGHRPALPVQRGLYCNKSKFPKMSPVKHMKKLKPDL